MLRKRKHNVWKRLSPILTLACLTIVILISLETVEEQHLKDLRNIDVYSVEKIRVFHCGEYSGIKEHILITNPVHIQNILLALRNVTYEGMEANFNFFMRDDRDSYYQLMFSKFNIVLTESDLHRSLAHPYAKENMWICLGNTDEALRCVKEAFLASDEVW